jgi:hypothetical protein
LFNGHIRKSADGFVTFANDHITWPGGKKYIYYQEWYKEFFAKLKVAWMAGPVVPSGYACCPRLCELSGTAGTGKSTGALLLIHAVSSEEWGEQPDILFVHRRDDFASLNLGTRKDGQAHLLTRDGNLARHFTFESGCPLRYMDCLLWHRLDKRRKVIVIVDSMAPALLLENILPTEELHLCLYIASVEIRRQAERFMPRDRSCWRFDSTWFLVTSVQKSEYLIFCRKCLSKVSRDWLRQTARLRRQEAGAFSDVDESKAEDDAEIEILRHAYDIFGGNLHYLMVLKTLSPPYGCKEFENILDCFNEASGHPTDIVKRAVLRACAELVFDSLDQPCGLLQYPSVQAFSFTVFSSLFVREGLIGMENGELIMYFVPSSPSMLQLLKKVLYSAKATIPKPLQQEIRRWLCWQGIYYNDAMDRIYWTGIPNVDVPADSRLSASSHDGIQYEVSTLVAVLAETSNFHACLKDPLLPLEHYFRKM